VKAATGDAKRQYGASVAALVGAGVALFALTLYVATLAPTVLYYDRPLLLDSVMLQVQAIVLGIPGGTGSPTWVMLTHLFTYLPLGDPAYRTNLASAVYAAAAVGMVYWTSLLLSRRVVAAAAGAVAFALGDTLWSVAVITEIYGLNVVLIMLPIASLLLWREHRRDRYLLLAAFFMGFALTDHLTSGLVLPAGVLFVALVDWRKLIEWRLVLKGIGLYLIGLAPYLYLPLRAATNPPLNEWNPTTFERFWNLVSGGTHQDLLFVFGPSELPARGMIYVEHLLDNFHWGLVMVAATGAAVLFLRDRAGGLLLGFLFAGWLFHALEYNIFDVDLYFLTTYAVLALWVSVGFGAILEAVSDAVSGSPRTVRRAAVIAFSAFALLLPLASLKATYEENDMSDAYRGQETLDAVAENAEKGATILHHRSELWYLVLVEKRRQDLTLVDPWFPGRVRYTDIVWPDDIDYVTSGLRWGTNDYTGVSSAMEAADRGAVYVLEQESTGPHNFYSAGFGTRRVEGHLFELTPPDQKQEGQTEDQASDGTSSAR
jgi:hypothetical protein